MSWPTPAACCHPENGWVFIKWPPPPPAAAAAAVLLYQLSLSVDLLMT
jgi:hypothetical protein